MSPALAQLFSDKEMSARGSRGGYKKILSCPAPIPPSLVCVWDVWWSSWFSSLEWCLRFYNSNELLRRQMELDHGPWRNKATGTHLGAHLNACHVNKTPVAADDLWTKAPDITLAYLWLLGHLMMEGDPLAQGRLSFGAASGSDSMASTSNPWMSTITFTSMWVLFFPG